MSHNMSPITELERLKREFLEYTEIEKGRSLKTIENYDRYLSRFLRFAKIEKPKDVSADLVREFRLWLNRQPARKNETLSRKTQNYYMIALRAFLKFLAKRGVESLSPEQIELAKIPERSLDLITPTELAKLMKAVNIYLKSRKDMSEALFVRMGKEADKPLDRRSIIRIIKKYATKAGIGKKVTPHVL